MLMPIRMRTVWDVDWQPTTSPIVAGNLAFCAIEGFETRKRKFSVGKRIYCVNTILFILTRQQN